MATAADEVKKAGYELTKEGWNGYLVEKINSFGTVYAFYLSRYVAKNFGLNNQSKIGSTLVGKVRATIDKGGEACAKLVSAFAGEGGISNFYDFYYLPNFQKEIKFLLKQVKFQADLYEENKKKEAEQKALLDPLQKQIAEAQAQAKATADKAAAEKAAVEKQLAETQQKLKSTTASGVKVRVKYSTTIKDDLGAKIGTAKVGTTLSVSAANTGANGLTAIVYQGRLAFVSSKDIQDVEEKVTSSGKVKVTTSKTTVASTKKSPSVQTTTSTPQAVPTSTPKVVPTKPSEEEGLSTGSKVAIAGGAVVVIGLIVYFATRKK